MSTNNHEISLEKAIEMTTRFRENKPANLPISETFSAEAINKLLSPEDCKFVRVYFGMHEDLTVSVIVVAADANNEDLLPLSEEGTATQNTNSYTIVEDGTRCPPDCPPESPLNP